MIAMAELGLSTASSSDVSTDIEPVEDSMEPSSKKLRMSSGKSGCDAECSGLEERLNGILCCTVCLDLPTSAMYQVNTNTGPWLVVSSIYL